MIVVFLDKCFRKKKKIIRKRIKKRKKASENSQKFTKAIAKAFGKYYNEKVIALKLWALHRKKANRT